jgi:hypothetical protein
MILLGSKACLRNGRGKTQLMHIENRSASIVIGLHEGGYLYGRIWRLIVASSPHPRSLTVAWTRYGPRRTVPLVEL